MAQLIRKTDAGDETHELLFRTTSIGRGALNDIVVREPRVRRVHAEVVSLGQHRYAVRPARAKSAVTVNGEPIAGPRTLEAGDRIRIGGSEFVFEPEPSDEAGAAPREASMARGVLKLALGTFASRLFGYVREMVALAYFGLSGVFDAYVVAISLPNLFRDVLGERVAESAFTPAHKTLVTRGRREAARRLAASILAIVAVSAIVLTILGYVLAPWLVKIMVPGFAAKRPELAALTLLLARMSMPYLAVIAVSAVFGSLLLSERRFLRYAVAPLGSSVCVILAVVLLHGKLDVGALVLGLVAGGTVQMLICGMPYLRRRKGEGIFQGGPAVAWRQPALRRVGRSAVPIVIAGLLSRVSSVVDRALASIPSLVAGTGRIGALYAAQRLLQLPFAIFGLAVGRAAFPSLIEQASSQERPAAGEADGFSRALVRGLRYNAFFMLPATVALMLLVRPLIRVMYERGQFTAAHTELAAIALFWYALGLIGMGTRTVLTRAFYALLNTRIPLLLAAVQAGVNVVLSVLLVMTPLQHGGLALATSISFWLEAVLLLVMLRRELARQERELVLDGLGSGLAKMAAAALVMALVTWGGLAFFSQLWLARSLPMKLALLGLPGALGLAAYIAVAALLRCEEVTELLHLRRRRA